MRLYLDTEFNGHGGELISMALIGQEERRDTLAIWSWYEAQTFPAKIDPWVREHVIPNLGRDPLPPAYFKRCFHDWIRQFDNPEIICDWHADAAHFCRMLEGVDYGSSLDFACRIMIIKTPSGHPISTNPHNALADAAALMRWNEMRLAA